MRQNRNAWSISSFYAVAATNTGARDAIVQEASQVRRLAAGLLVTLRNADQRIGNSLLGALDLMDELWGQWNYNKEYDQVQFSPPGAVKKYSDFLEAIQAAFQEQKELQGQ